MKSPCQDSAFPFFSLCIAAAVAGLVTVVGACLFTRGMTILTVLFLTPLFKNLPEAVLAAMIIHAVWHILSSPKLLQVRLISPTEFWLGVLTFAGVIFIDVLQGMVLGLLASLILVIYHSSRPHLAVLGRLPGITDAYVDLKRHPDSVAVAGVLIFRLDAPLYYANALTVRDQIKELLEASETPTRALLFDALTQDSLDLTSAEMLMSLVKEFHTQGMDVYVAGAHAPVVEFSRKVGLLDLIGEENVFPTVDTAVRFIESKS